MSNRSQVNENSPIAGEPANNPALKTVPPLDGQEADNQVAKGELNQGRSRAVLVVQTVSIIIALLLSAYSFTIIDSLDSSANSDSGNYGALVGSSELVIFVADNGLTGMELHLWSPLTLQDEWLIW